MKGSFYAFCGVYSVQGVVRTCTVDIGTCGIIACLKMKYCSAYQMTCCLFLEIENEIESLLASLVRDPFSLSLSPVSQLFQPHNQDGCFSAVEGLGVKQLPFGVV